MTPEIHSSPAAQWLQGLLAKGAPSQVGSRSNPGASELPQDSSRISAQAFQLNQAAGASTTAHARSGQPLAVSAPLPHHHVHIEDKKNDPTFVSRMAQATVSPLEQGRRIDAPVNYNNDGSSTPSSVHNDHERAAKISHDLRAAYSRAQAAPQPDNNRTQSISILV